MMVDILLLSNNRVIKYVSKAIDQDVYAIEIEYKDGNEEVPAMKGSFGDCNSQS
jgi:hypothetical protein